MPSSTLYRPAKVLRKKLAKPVGNRKSVWQVLVLYVWQNDHGLASKTKLNGVCVARRNFEKPADITTSLIRSSPACAPSAGPSSFKDAGTQIIVDPEYNALPSGLKLSSCLSLAKGSTSIHVPFFFFNVSSTCLAAPAGFPMSWKQSKNATKS